MGTVTSNENVEDGAMAGDELQLGSIARIEDGFEGRLARVFAHDVGSVWRMLVEPAAMAQWLAPGSIEPRVGGAVKIDFADSGTIIDSRVAEYEPRRVLAYSWSSGSEPPRPLRWELVPDGEGTRLNLTVRVPASEDPAKACAGFEGHLDMLAAALEGVPIKFPFNVFLAARAGYRKMVEAAG